VFDTPAQPTTPANTPTNNPPAKKFDVFAGLDTGSKSAPAASQQDKPNLFGDYQATPSGGSSNPFGDSNQQDEGENDFSNPYATPKTSSPMGSMGASSPSSSNQSTIAIILGISSLVFMGMGLCCCPLFLGSMLMSSIGLFLSYRLPKQSRLLPLILNWIAMGLSLLLLTIYIGLIALDVSRQRKFQTQFNQTQFNQSQSSPNPFSPSSRSSQQTRTEEMHQEMMNKHREMMEKMKAKSR
jgi:hypothetical protein